MPLTIEQIRAARNSAPKRAVDCPDLGGEVFVRALTLKEVREIQDFQANPKNKPIDVTRKIIELSACNEDGSPLFVGEDKGLIDGLTWATVSALSEATTDISGMNKGAEEEAKKG